MFVLRFLLIVAFTGLCAIARAESSLEFLNPDGLFKPSTFTQVVIGKGGRMVFISGQTARNADSIVVGIGDVKAQTEQAIKNLRVAVEAAGGSMADIAKITTFIVDLKPDDRIWIGTLVRKYFPRPPAHTLIGISDLATPELLVEIEAFAVLR